MQARITNHVLLKLKEKNTKNILVGVVYRAHTSIDNFISDINDSIFKHEPHIITIEQRTFYLGSNNGKHAYLVCKGIVQYLGCQIVLKFHSLPPNFASKPNIHSLDNLSDIIIQHTSHLEGLILK